MIAAIDEHKLLRKLRDGDHGAYNQIYLHYRNRLIANMLRLLKSPDLVEELLQELFTRLWERRSQIDPDQSLNAYLYRIANNLVYDLFRKAARNKQLQEQLLYLRHEAYRHVDEYIYNKENIAQLQDAMAQLPPQQRRVFELVKLEEKSHQEVSEILSISPGTVNNHLHRAMIFLRHHFSSNTRSGALLLSYLLFRELHKF